MYWSRVSTVLSYDQMLYEDENKNRMVETKELFEWVLKQRCFEVLLYYSGFTVCVMISWWDLIVWTPPFDAENIHHAVPEQVWYFREEGSESKVNKYLAVENLLIKFHVLKYHGLIINRFH